MNNVGTLNTCIRVQVNVDNILCIVINYNLFLKTKINYFVGQKKQNNKQSSNDK